MTHDVNFTLKGVARPISLDLEANPVSRGQGYGDVAGTKFRSRVMLNRSDFGFDVDQPRAGLLAFQVRS